TTSKKGLVVSRSGIKRHSGVGAIPPRYPRQDSIEAPRTTEPVGPRALACPDHEVVSTGVPAGKRRSELEPSAHTEERRVVNEPSRHPIYISGRVSCCITELQPSRRGIQ